MAAVSIAQQKGGAGKTTLAVQLGVAWLVAGKRIAMLDIDPRASLFTWFNLRRFRQEFDHVLVDSSPHWAGRAAAPDRPA